MLIPVRCVPNLCKCHNGRTVNVTESLREIVRFGLENPMGKDALN